MNKRIAQYSYGIYVSHVPILWLCFVKFHFASAVSAVMSILLTTLVSIVLYHWLEDPAIRLGKRFATKLSQGTALA
jgi:peptidoglycan/LPS O-acetylase OafA/YrhL